MEFIREAFNVGPGTMMVVGGFSTFFLIIVGVRL